MRDARLDCGAQGACRRSELTGDDPGRPCLRHAEEALADARTRASAAEQAANAAARRADALHRRAQRAEAAARLALDEREVAVSGRRDLRGMPFGRALANHAATLHAMDATDIHAALLRLHPPCGVVGCAVCALPSDGYARGKRLFDELLRLREDNGRLAEELGRIRAAVAGYARAVV